ncbi:hypothetical protein C8R44DRAFT_883283 [Mycena epipterygia]|nr:hypothetical protein C8R44DRAFT_883283 [Mycena epipterygia]
MPYVIPGPITMYGALVLPSTCADASFEVLLNTTVSTFSARRTKLRHIADIDVALKDVERAHSTVKTAHKSPVKQALKLFRSRSTAKLNTRLESHRVLADENATVVSLAQELIAGTRDLLSLQLFELVLLRRALRTRRNSLAAVARLPTEVLAPILELCPTIGDDGPHFRTGNFIWGLKIAHVCRRWREIAMKSSYFWTHIVLSRPRWALEMLHRSRAAPLVVGIDFGASPTKTVAARDLVLAQLSRIRELRVRMPAFRGVPSSLFAPAPVLDTFYLWCEALTDGFLVPALFQGKAPALRYLSLRCFGLECAAPLWNQLVSLELINAPRSELLMVALPKMPHLRALTLDESIPETVEGADPVLLGLETLELTASSWQCSCFLRVVLLPACRIILNVRYLASDLRFVWDALEILRKGADDPVICGLQFTDLPSLADGASLFEVSFFTRSGTWPRYSIRLALGPPVLPNWREETIYTVLSIMSLDQVSALTVQSAALKLSTSLLQMKQFRSVAFHRHLEPFTEPLDDDPLMAAGDLTRFDPVDAAVHFPRVRRIAFSDIAFSEGSTEAILDWLAQRRRLNLGIEEIRMVGCTLTTAQLGSLREVVCYIFIGDR